MDLAFFDHQLSSLRVIAMVFMALPPGMGRPTPPQMGWPISSVFWPPPGCPSPRLDLQRIRLFLQNDNAPPFTHAIARQSPGELQRRRRSAQDWQARSDGLLDKDSTAAEKSGCQLE